MRVEVRNNNVDKAIRILKKKLTEEVCSMNYVSVNFMRRKDKGNVNKERCKTSSAT